MSAELHIFFDLDHTLWDLELNSKESLTELFNELEINRHCTASPEEFFAVFNELNHKYWELFAEGSVTKEQMRLTRFQDLLSYFSVNDGMLAEKLSAEYISRTPFRKNLVPYAFETLQYLSAKYPLHIITNGFDEVQQIKMRSAGIEAFFNEVITSEKAGCRKPSQEIFRYAEAVSGSNRFTSIMIGDNYRVDVLGAQSAGWQGVWYNPSLGKSSRSCIACLRDLQHLF